MDVLIKGNTLILGGKLGENISGYKIRAQLWDGDLVKIKKATANSGGTDNQIKITDEVSGAILIRIEKGETTNILKTATLEIEMETNDIPTEKYTICKEILNFSDRGIDWEIPD